MNEANEFKDWCVSTLSQRVYYLLKYLEIPQRRDAINELKQIGNKTVSLFSTDEFSVRHGNKRRLTPSGYALAADIGFAIAQYLFEEYKLTLYWGLVQGSKYLASRNLPALYGFNTPKKFYDPFTDAIAEAWPIMNGDKDTNRWVALYSYLRANVVS